MYSNTEWSALLEVAGLLATPHQSDPGDIKQITGKVDEALRDVRGTTLTDIGATNGLIVGLAARALGLDRFHKNRVLEELHTACLFDQILVPRVVVIGVVNRGKSTLVNDLSARYIAPQSYTPETATLLALLNDKARRPIGFTIDGSHLRLPRSSSRFSNALKRATRVKLASAIYPCVEMLPENLALIDTPGVEEAEQSANEGALVYATKVAIRHATAAIVVLGVPGIKGSDVQLIRETVEILRADRTMVVIKANDSSIEMNDVAMWKDELDLEPELAVVLLVDSDKSGLSAIHTFLQSVSRTPFSPKRHEQMIDRVIDGGCRSVSHNQPLKVGRSILKELPPDIRSKFEAVQPRQLRKNQKKTLRSHKRSEKLRRDQAKRDFKNAMTAWREIDSSIKASLATSWAHIAECEEELGEAQRYVNSLGAGFARFWSGDIARNAQRLRIQQGRTKLQLAISKKDEWVLRQSQHLAQRPSFSQFSDDNQRT